MYLCRGVVKKVSHYSGFNREVHQNTTVLALAFYNISGLFGDVGDFCMSDGKFEPLEWTDKFCDFQLKTVLKPYIGK